MGFFLALNAVEGSTIFRNKSFKSPSSLYVEMTYVQVFSRKDSKEEDLILNFSCHRPNTIPKSVLAPSKALLLVPPAGLPLNGGLVLPPVVPPLLFSLFPPLLALSVLVVLGVLFVLLL